MNSPLPAWSPDVLVESSNSSMTSTLRRELWIISRSRSLVVASLGISLLLATVYNYGSRPLYQSTAVISLDAGATSPLTARNNVDQTRKVAALNDQKRILESHEMALKAVTGADSTITSELAKGPLGDWKERLEEEARYRLGFQTEFGTGPSDLVTSFRSRLSVNYEPPETWIYVRMTGYDPEATAVAANYLVDIYIEEAKKLAQGAAGNNRQELEDKVTKRQDRVAETLGKLEKLEDKEGLQNADTRRLLLQKEIARLQDSLITTRQAQLTRRALFDEVSRATLAGMLAIPAVRDDHDVSDASNRITDLEAKISRASATLGDLHPELVGLRSDLDSTRKRLSARLASLRDSVARDYRLSQREEGSLTVAIDNAQRELSRLDKNSFERSFIQKQAEAGQRAVGELIAKSVREADEELFFTPKVLQKAEAATAPASPQRARNFQYALAIGLIVGLSLAWLRSHLDETVKTPEDLKAHIGLPLLGMVPRVNSSTFDLFNPDDKGSTSLFEAYRVLRTNLTVGEGAKKNRLLLVTSSREAEGKTTTSCGLGIALARAGQRVLLLDGDLRRASLSRLLNATDRRGLTDVMEGAAMAECVARTPTNGLYLLPSGTARADASEMLNHDSVSAIVDAMRQEFDWIVCDAPPVLAVADAAILCRLADSVLVVIGANSTPVGSIRATLDQLSAVGAKVRGLVLNKVDLGRDSHYYRHYYSAHYADYSQRTKSDARNSSGRPSRAPRPVPSSSPLKQPR